MLFDNIVVRYTKQFLERRTALLHDRVASKAHAIEWWQHQPAEAPAASVGEPRRTYTHGEAVAIGIVAVAIARDKKAEASKGSGSKTVNYVLPVRIGKVVISAVSLPS